MAVIKADLYHQAEAMNTSMYLKGRRGLINWELSNVYLERLDVEV